MAKVVKIVELIARAEQRYCWAMTKLEGGSCMCQAADSAKS